MIEERKQIRNALDKEVNKINENKMQLSILYYKQNLVNKVRKHQSRNQIWTNQRNNNIMCVAHHYSYLHINYNNFHHKKWKILDTDQSLSRMESLAKDVFIS